MQLLEQRILAEGEVKSSEILKVDRFLNHQMDPKLFLAMAEEWKRLFDGCGVNKLVTIEASGIGIAAVAGLVFGCPVVFAKKTKSRNVSDDAYTTVVHSFTHGNDNTIRISREYLSAHDRVLVIDDFLANGAALDGLITLIESAGATVVGAGIATVMAEGISALLCAWHIYRRIPLLHLARRELKIDRRLLRETVSSGAITAMQQACQPIGKALIQSVMNAQGVSVIAAFNAVSRVDDFACIPEQSISSGMMTCIAQNRGAGEHARVGETLRRGMAMEAVYGVLICAAVLLAKEPVMRLFAAQDSVRMVSMGVDYLTLMAFFYILPGITNGLQGYFRGMGEMKTTLTATFIQISIRALVVAVLVPRIGLNGAAWACAVGWSAMLCYTFARYRRVRENE